MLLKSRINKNLFHPDKPSFAPRSAIENWRKCVSRCFFSRAFLMFMSLCSLYASTFLSNPSSLPPSRLSLHLYTVACTRIYINGSALLLCSCVLCIYIVLFFVLPCLPVYHSSLSSTPSSPSLLLPPFSPPASARAGSRHAPGAQPKTKSRGRPQGKRR